MDEEIVADVTVAMDTSTPEIADLDKDMKMTLKHNYQS